MNASDEKKQHNILHYFPDPLIPELNKLLNELGGEVNEIRLRVGRPAVAMLSDGYRILCKDMLITADDIHSVFEKVCDYSVYSHYKELAQGYITVPGGHRVGICGTASLDKNGNRTVQYLSSLNFRISVEHIGCSDEIFDKLFHQSITGVLVAGPPCSGKTTLLKDFGLKLSSSPFCRKTVLVDERNELAAVYRGVPQNTVGDFCDVLSGYPKGEGIMNAVRTLSPDVIICDEIGNREDAEAVCDAINAGVVIISSVHACNVAELYRREPIRKLLQSGAFEKVALLKGGCCRCQLDSIVEAAQYEI